MAGKLFHSGTSLLYITRLLEASRGESDMFVLKFVFDSKCKCLGPVACARLALVVFGGPEVHITHASCREAAMGFYYAFMASALCVRTAFCNLCMSRRHQGSSAF